MKHIDGISLQQKRPAEAIGDGEEISERQKTYSAGLRGQLYLEIHKNKVLTRIIWGQSILLLFLSALLLINTFG